MRDWVGIFRRAISETLDDSMPMIASAVAYSSFFAIPSVLLLVAGVFTLAATPETVDELMDRFSTFMPAEATELLGDSLERLGEQPSTGILVTVAGFVLALWATTSAMTTYMAALAIAYDRSDRRGFLRKRLVALVLVVAIGAAVLLVGLLLVFGPYVESYLGDALEMEPAISWIWWTAQWPLLVLGLLVAFAVVRYLGLDVEHRRWRLITPGGIVAVFGWLVASGGFAVYASLFGSYNKAWGSLSAVIVTLTWLWLTALAMLFGAEVDAELEHTRD